MSSEQLLPTPVDMAQGLAEIKRLASARWKKHGSLLLIICGNQGVGKSTLLDVLADTCVGGIVETDRIFVDPNYELASKPNKRDPLEYSLYKGTYPSEALGKIFLSTLAGGGEILRGLFCNDERLMLVGLQCDQATRGRNIFYRRLRESSLGGSWVLRQSMKVTRDLLYLPERQRGFTPETRLDLLIDVSANSRLDPDEAKERLTRVEV